LTSDGGKISTFDAARNRIRLPCRPPGYALPAAKIDFSRTAAILSLAPGFAWLQSSCLQMHSDNDDVPRLAFLDARAAIKEPSRNLQPHSFEFA